MSDLSILCVTRAEPEVRHLLRQLVEDAHGLGADCVLVADGREALDRLAYPFSTSPLPHGLAIVESKGYVESVLDEALSFTTRNYVLRIDDDERMSREMVEWLRSGAYRAAPHWKFCRAHLCVDSEHYITDLPLWPDEQTRLSVRSQAGGRHTIHCGSPFGGGELAPVVLEHWKFIVKSLAERAEIITRYERCQPGSGSNFAVFSTPELVMDSLALAPLQEAYQRAVEMSMPVGVEC